MFGERNQQASHGKDYPNHPIKKTNYKWMAIRTGVKSRFCNFLLGKIHYDPMGVSTKLLDTWGFVVNCDYLFVQYLDLKPIQST